MGEIKDLVNTETTDGIVVNIWKDKVGKGERRIYAQYGFITLSFPEYAFKEFVKHLNDAKLKLDDEKIGNNNDKREKK